MTFLYPRSLLMLRFACLRGVSVDQLRSLRLRRFVVGLRFRRLCLVGRRARLLAFGGSGIVVLQQFESVFMLVFWHESQLSLISYEGCCFGLCLILCEGSGVAVAVFNLARRQHYLRGTSLCVAYTSESNQTLEALDKVVSEFLNSICDTSQNAVFRSTGHGRDLLTSAGVFRNEGSILSI